MSDFDNIRYSHSFLNQVIIRIDFLEFVPTDSVFSTDIEKNILQFFSHRGKNQIIRFNSISLNFNTPNQGIPNASSEALEGLQREYFSQDGANKVILSNKAIVFEINKYSSFEDHISQITQILSAFWSKNRITATRIGIRYINILNSEKIKLRKNFFAPEISATLKAIPKQNDFSLIRSMHLSEYRCSDMTLNFRYGMYNQEYPNMLKDDSFALDFDCFSSDPITTSDEVLLHIRNGHNAIQTLFERSISDSLRAVMNRE